MNTSHFFYLLFEALGRARGCHYGHSTFNQLAVTVCLYWLEKYARISKMLRLSVFLPLLSSVSHSTTKNFPSLLCSVLLETLSIPCCFMTVVACVADKSCYIRGSIPPPRPWFIIVTEDFIASCRPAPTPRKDGRSVVIGKHGPKALLKRGADFSRVLPWPKL